MSKPQRPSASRMQFKLQLNTAKNESKPKSLAPKCELLWDTSEPPSITDNDDSHTLGSYFPFKPVIIHRNLKSQTTKASVVPRVGEVRYLDVFNGGV